ncbi:protein-tyrosine kinase [Parabacteroides sp. OttesenSCG-928-G07]|nr:protein-tyrosine kinase [Parabacteroides sp. OttesenSCG-928-G07]
MKRDVITIENEIVSVPVSAEIWMTQHQLADLFQCFVSKINANIRAILKTSILDETNVCRTCHYKNGDFVEQYSLEMIVALSFRIKSKNTEIFREWLMNKVLSQNSLQLLLISNFQSNKPMLN